MAQAAAAGRHRPRPTSFTGTACGRTSHWEAAARGITGRIAATRCVRTVYAARGFDTRKCNQGKQLTVMYDLFGRAGEPASDTHDTSLCVVHQKLIARSEPSPLALPLARRRRRPSLPRRFHRSFSTTVTWTTW